MKPLSPLPIEICPCPQLPTGSITPKACPRHRSEQPDIEYPSFRESFFFNETFNHRIRHEGSELDPMSSVKESKRLWTANGPWISNRVAKTATSQGSAFRNAAFSPDRLYSTNRRSLGYEVHRSLRGTSLCSTVKRFPQSRENGPGPGAYSSPSVDDIARAKIRSAPKPVRTGYQQNERLQQWQKKPDYRALDSGDVWKKMSDVPSATNYSFQRSKQPTWIEKIEHHQQQTFPVATKPSLTDRKKKLRRHQEDQMPDFIQGQSTNFITSSKKLEG